MDCAAEPDAPQCRDDQSAPEGEEGAASQGAPSGAAEAAVEPEMASEDER